MNKSEETTIIQDSSKKGKEVQYHKKRKPRTIRSEIGNKMYVGFVGVDTIDSID